MKAIIASKSIKVFDLYKLWARISESSNAGLFTSYRERIRILVHIWHTPVAVTVPKIISLFNQFLTLLFTRPTKHHTTYRIRHIPHGIRTSINCYSVSAMENLLRSNLFFQCRLCGVGGAHEVDIWDRRTLSVHSDCSDYLSLSEKIFECIGVQVSRLRT